MRIYQQFLYLLLLCFSGLIIVSCNNETRTSTETTANTAKPEIIFDKLVGTWQSTYGNDYERWTKNEDGTYQSFVFMVSEKDTVWKEQASVFPEKENWVFETRVSGQNNGEAIRFVSSQLTENSVQFSNPAHDFPTDINYTMPDANTVHAFIVGPNDKGGKDTIPFDYTRVIK